MINVLAHGNKYEQAVCPKYGCIFEYSAEDVHKNTKTIGLIAWDVVYKEVKCPECRCGITVG